MLTVELKQGLGDCLVAAASIQRLGEIKGEKINFITNSAIEPLLRFHPNITYLSTGIPDITLKWSSNLGQNIFPLHTMQRFSIQLGFFLDPTRTLDIYNEHGMLKNKQTRNLICINTSSKEEKRRFIPDWCINLIESESKIYGNDIVYIGNCGDRPSISNIEEMTKLLLSCRLFIGPVSFPYHLASALKCKSLTFFSYMPSYKFSDFINTTPIDSNRECVKTCEEDERSTRSKEQCFMSKCKAVDYNKEDILTKLSGLIK